MRGTMFRALIAVAGLRIGALVKDAGRRLALAAVAAVFLILALAFATLSGFLWLATVIAPPLAALSVTGVLLLVALILLLLARRKKHAPAATTAATTTAVAAGSPLAAVAAQAQSLGEGLGGGKKSLPLILGALALGLLLGRRR